MKRLLPLLMLLIAGCGPRLGHLASADDTPQASKERPCELLVKVRAEAKKGLRTLGKEGDYGEASKERADSKIKRVNYSQLADMVVLLEGPGADKAIPSDESNAEIAITLSEQGFSRDMAAVMLAHPREDKVAEKLGKMGGSSSKTTTDFAKAMWLGTPVYFTNKLAESVTIYGVAENDDFNLTLPAGTSATVHIDVAGEYEVFCENSDAWHCKLIASTSAFLRDAKAGDDLKFFLPPGTFKVKVYAPRLPTWTGEITVVEGAKNEVAATLGVNSLPKQK